MRAARARRAAVRCRAGTARSRRRSRRPPRARPAGAPRCAAGPGCCLPLRPTGWSSVVRRVPEHSRLPAGDRAARDLAGRGDRARARRLRGVRRRRVADAAEGLPRRVSERRLPRDAGQGGRARDPQVGHLVSAQSRGRAAGGDGDDLRLVGGDGEPLALVDVRSVTRSAHRRGRGGGRAGARARGRASVGIVGCGLHGTWAARCLAAAEYGPGVCFDPDPEAAGQLAGELGWEAGTPRGRARLRRRHLRDAGQRAGRASRATCGPASTSTCSAPTAPARRRPSPRRWRAAELFCDEWEQASHGGELTGAVEAGLVDREQVDRARRRADRRRSGPFRPDAITLFDSTGLAIQDLALCLALLEAHRAGRVRADTVRL